MELFDELLLSLITILLALLIAKIAPLAADLGRAPSTAGDQRSVELKELKSRERSEQVEPAVQILGSDGDTKELDDLEAELIKEEESEEEERSELLDLAIEEEYVKKLDEEERYKVDELPIEEKSREKLGESVKIVEEDDGAFSEAEQLVDKRPLIDEEGCNCEIGGAADGSIDEKAGSLLHGEDEWEGIERSELEKLFAMAIEYVGGQDGGHAVSKLSGDVQKQLNGLQKVAVEGLCYEPQPLALKVLARAIWHSWQKLGNMTPEVAMEQYIALLSENIPGWMRKQPGVDIKQGRHNDPVDLVATRTDVPTTSSFPNSQQTGSGTQRTFEDSSSVEVDKQIDGLKLVEKGFSLTFVFSLLSPTRACCY